MRIGRVDLIRYGKFTNHSVHLPAAERDFHVVVGANEAGKSTFRWAIQDLLYGIPRNTPHGFKHAMPFIADDLFINYDDARSKEGLEALGELSRKTQVVFLTHHDHLLPAVRHVFGAEVNVVNLAS